MKFIVLDDHVCMVAVEEKRIDGRRVWVPKRITLCGGHGLTKHGISLLSDEVPPSYLCSKCDSVSNRRRSPSIARHLPQTKLKKIPRYEHLPGKTGIHLVHR